MDNNVVTLRIPPTMVGQGSSRRMADLVRELGGTRALIVTDEGVVKASLLDNIKKSLEKADIPFAIWDGCLPNAPSSTMDKGAQMAKNCDILIGVGGGSAMDTAKILAVMAANGLHFKELLDGKTEEKKTLPKILLPTTSGTGSEWSSIAVYTDETAGMKKWFAGDLYYGNAVVLDAELTLSMPPKTTADTGMDALCHAVESYTNPQATILSDMFGETAIKLIAGSIREAYARGSKAVEARNRMSVAASLAMEAATLAYPCGLAHLLNSYILSKSHATTHGEAVIILLPHIMRFELIACPDRYAQIARFMGENIDGLSVMEGAEKSIASIKRLARDLNMPQTMGELGINESDIQAFVNDAMETRLGLFRQASSRDVTPDAIYNIFRAAL